MTGILNTVERLGNRLPHPVTLFALATGLVIGLSALAARWQWSVDKLAFQADGTLAPAGSITANSLLSSDGIWWFVSHLVENFINFPPLGIVLVGMLGIGVAERSGFIPALLTRIAAAVSDKALTPTVMFLGIMSSVGLDAGYVVLPPIAAALFHSAGRSPLVGIAVAFAGISAGFSANLVITAIDPLLAGFTESAAQFLVADYRVAVTANWWFMAVSTVILTAVGWLVTSKIVEARLGSVTVAEMESTTEGQSHPADPSTSAKALGWALFALGFGVVAILISIYYPGAPLAGLGKRFPRWVEATVPLIFILFILPGLVYGFKSGTFKTERDVAQAMGDTFAGLGPYIVMAFFAAQFIESFKYSRLGEMLAVSGGGFLIELGLPSIGLVIGLVLIVMLGNLLIGSASAKYAFFAPVFVPMLMYVGISPELTQAAFRIGDSTTNIITPLNPYMIIIVALLQRYVRGAGIGTVVAMMLPYTVVFALVWIAMLVVWMSVGVPLGPGGPLHYPP